MPGIRKLPDPRFLFPDSRMEKARRSTASCKAARRSDRSPLHDVRHHARRAENRRRADWYSRERIWQLGRPSGGARRDRTDDLLLAKQALSQLSYGPDQRAADGQRRTDKTPLCRPSRVFRRLILVGLGRFELPTSRLSSARSNQLSYKPVSEDRGQTTDDRRAHLSSVVSLLSSDKLVREEREMKTAASR
jgi:hypothetical protein